MKRKGSAVNFIKQAVCILLVAVVATHSHSLLMPFFDLQPMAAEAKKSTQQQINEEQAEKERLEDELKEQQEDLQDLKGTKKKLQKEVNALNDQLTEISEKLVDLENQISLKLGEIKQSSEELEHAIETVNWQYSCMVIRVRDMYERRDFSIANAILSSSSIGDMLNAADWYETIAAYDRKKLQEFQEEQAAVEKLKAKLEQEKLELDALKLETEVEKNQIAGLISQTSNNLADCVDQIDEAEKEALEYERQIKEKEETLENLKKILEEEKRLSQAAANATWRNISEVTFAEGDRTLLANLIYCEAGGEPYEGKLAVGSVVINRVLSSKYADTVVGVIYQKGQFSPVRSGRFALALEANKANADCYRAADEAMSGVTNVGNCVYFRTPIPGLTGIAIGNHIFY